MTNGNSTTQHKWPELLMQMLVHGTATAQQCGLDNNKAGEVAMAIVINYAKTFGGCQIYLPKGDALARAVRDMEIYQQAGKTDAIALAHQYNLSSKRIWEIQRTQRDLHIQRIQPSLF